MAQKKSKNTSELDEFLKTARKRFDLAADAESEIRKLALEDLKFRAGEQWPSDVKQSRDLDRRPCLTINRIPQFIRQITNDQRQNRPSLKVNPVDNEADIEVAKIYQGIIRHIEYNSNADVAYDTAFEGAATKGIGYFRVVTDYVSPDSFDQEIFIKRVRNSFSVYLDPSYQEPDASDASWGFVFEDMTREDYELTYPDSKMSAMEDWRSLGDSAPGWCAEDTVRVAEYFYKEFKTKTIYLMNDKSVIDDEANLEQAYLMGLSIEKKKTVQVPIIHWCKINAVEKLESTEWMGRWIPIIPVLGDELDVDGKRILEGIVRHAKDPQRMYNYWATSETETIALAPRAPFIGVEGQFEGHEQQWKTANVKNHAYLEYKPKSIGGAPVGPPQRNVFEPPIQAITQARMQSSEDLKATTGIYDAALGARASETSGIAIQRRANQSQTANFHYVDNLSRALRHLGRVLVDLIPKVYDTDRAIRIVGEDDSQEVITINKVFERNGKPVIYDLSAGKYDVTISNGPSYATKRQEALASMLDLTKAYPQVAQVAGDLMIKNMDWPGAQEIAERVKKTLPPGVADDEKSKNQELPQEAVQQMQQMGQMIDQLTAQLNEAKSPIALKQMEIDSRERIEFAKIETQLKIKLAEIDAADSRALLSHEIEQLNSQQEKLGMFKESEDEDFAQEGMSPQQTYNPTGGPTPGNYME